MFRLKQFGATASSWLKKLNPYRKDGSKSLKATLFVQPLAIIFLSLGLILLIFNLSLRTFVNDEVNTAVQHRYDQLDKLYLGQTVEDNQHDSIFSTSYVIVDEQFKTLYISASQDEISASSISNQVVNYFTEHDEDWELLDEAEEEELEIEEPESGSQPVFVPLNGRNYAVKIQEYEGRLEDYYVRQSESSDQTYYILVFANVSPVQKFSALVNWILTGLTLVIGLLASGLIFLTSRKLDDAFFSLKTYISKVGQREQNLVLERLPYDELNQVGQSVETMNHMIDANQRSQKIFFQNASHELRTPLMSIQGYAEAIGEGVVTDPQAAAAIIQEESAKMKQLVDDILTLARVEDFQQALEVEDLSLTDLLYDVSWRLKPKADLADLQFVHHFQDSKDQIQADEALLERAISNILHNALRFARKTITLTTKQVKDGFEIRLSNDGQPISPEDMEHVFERFHKGKNGNFGIGLAMTKEIIERHGGSISVQSDEAATSFIIFLPTVQK